MDLNNSKKIIFITGATSGIGEAAANLLSNKYNLILCGRREERLLKIKNRLSKKTEVITLNFDVRSKEDVTDKINSLPDKWKKINILINNAGNAHGLDFIDEGDISDWDKMIDINVKGLLYVTKQVLSFMLIQNSGHIINVGSIDGIKTPRFDNFSYGPSKAAVHHLTRVLASHLVRRNIIVNGIAPGPFPTFMLSAGVGGGGDVENTDWDQVGQANPRGRVGTPEDIAGLAIFLSSRARGFTIGDVITCDGGTVVS